MLRIALGLIFWTLAMGIPSLRAQDAQGHPIGSPSQTPPDAWSDDSRTTIVPRTNTPAAKDIGEGPSPADAWWKLGRMYADRGDHARAFPIFSDLVDSYRTGSDGCRDCRHSHVALGVYYLKGIPGTLPADPDFGYGLLEYAASYFGDPNAQYELGRLLLDGPRKNVIQAAPPRNRGSARPPWPAVRFLLDCPHPLPPVQQGLHRGDVLPRVRIQASGDDLAQHGDALARDLFERPLAVLAVEKRRQVVAHAPQVTGHEPFGHLRLAGDGRAVEEHVRLQPLVRPDPR